MAETRLVVEHREQLWSLLVEAAQFEHMIMRPEGMERADAAEFVPAAPPPEPVGPAELMPRVQGFLTVGHLYRGIEQGLSDLAGVLKPLGTALTRLPMGPGNPGRTAGAAPA
jgi:hypothetical protein